MNVLSRILGVLIITVVLVGGRHVLHAFLPDHRTGIDVALLTSLFALCLSTWCILRWLQRKAARMQRDDE